MYIWQRVAHTVSEKANAYNILYAYDAYDIFYILTIQSLRKYTDILTCIYIHITCIILSIAKENYLIKKRILHRIVYHGDVFFKIFIIFELFSYTYLSTYMIVCLNDPKQSHHIRGSEM
jgi:hypothetical protein